MFRCKRLPNDRAACSDNVADIAADVVGHRDAAVVPHDADVNAEIPSIDAVKRIA